MIIAQISDLHIGFKGKDVECSNGVRLTTVVDEFNSFLAKPDVVICTGDLVEKGEAWAYRELKAILKKIECPVYLAFGNHDNRKTFSEVFPHIPLDGGFLQYALDDFPVKIIVVDTLREGWHGGSFCDKRGAWLEAELAKHPEKPTVIAMHHPPIRTGIGWLTSDPDSEWTTRLRSIIKANKQVVHVMAGHVHRSLFKKFAGTTISVAQAIAPQTKLELADIDPNIPDGRGMLVESRPGYCLHFWDGESMTTHSGQAPHGKVLFHYSDQYAYVVKHTLDLDH